MDSDDLAADTSASQSAGSMEAIPSASAEDLKAAASDPTLNEDLALALLKRNDLPPEVLEQLSKNSAASKSRKVKLALVRHPKTPRYVSLAMLRHLFTFDLMQVALTPVAAGDVKMAAEEALINRLESISSGERLSLARRASGRVAGALLVDSELRVMQAALENPRMTEALIIKALMGAKAPAALVRKVCYHPAWSLRREIQVALLRNPKTPIESALEFARRLPAPLVREILQSSPLPAMVKSSIVQELTNRTGAKSAQRRS